MKMSIHLYDGIPGLTIRSALREIGKYYPVLQFGVSYKTPEGERKDIACENKLQWLSVIESLKKQNVVHQTVTVHSVFNLNHVHYGRIVKMQ